MNNSNNQNGNKATTTPPKAPAAPQQVADAGADSASEDDSLVVWIPTKHDIGRKGSGVSIDSDIILNTEQARGSWGKHIQFILACVGYAVGLGNVWRFPKLVYDNGGGAFLIPYFLALISAGLPLFYLELSLGQFVSLGPMGLFKRLMPALQGVGVGMVLISFMVSIYFNMIIAWIIFYLFSATLSIFRKGGLEWTSCSPLNPWNTPDCYSVVQHDECKKLSSFAEFYNYTCYYDTAAGNANDTMKNWTGPLLPVNVTLHQSYATVQYWRRHVLHQTDSLEDWGNISPALVASLTAAWFACFLCMWKGVESLGKVVYFTATFPYFALVGLFGFGLTLDGAADGIIYYVKPNFTKLLEFEVWVAAYSQIFYSCGVGFGSLITMASYNKFTNNCMRDALVVASINCMTSLFTGFIIFSFVGFMAKQRHSHVGEVIQSGAGLVFVAYPEAFSQMEPIIGETGASCLAALFFIMLFTIGVDSQFSMVETVTTALLDTWVDLRKRKTLVIGIACAVMYLLGLFFTFGNGVYILQLYDTFSAAIGLILLVMIETLLVSLFYKQEVDKWRKRTCREWFFNIGIFAFARDIEFMLGKRQSYYWIVTLSIVAPASLFVILIATIATSKGTEYEGYKFPAFAEFLGWIMALTPVLMVPLCGIFRVFKVLYWKKTGVIDNLPKYIRKLFRTSRFWMPAQQRLKYKYESRLHTRTLSITSQLPHTFKLARVESFLPPNLRQSTTELRKKEERPSGKDSSSESPSGDPHAARKDVKAPTDRKTGKKKKAAQAPLDSTQSSRSDTTSIHASHEVPSRDTLRRVMTRFRVLSSTAKPSPVLTATEPPAR